MSKFSIILPVRNGGHYVKECVQSILSQSLPDFNLIILDNCSTDGTLQWLQSLDDRRIAIYPSEKSLSIEENWGRIVGVPKNEFITLIGHDDVLHREYLQVMDALLRKHPKATLYQTHFRFIDAQGKLIRCCKPMDEVQSPAEFVAFFLANMIDTMGTGFMMRAADYDALGGIPRYPNLLFADFELFINLTAKGYKATAAEEGFSFRLHQSTTRTSPDVKMQLAFDRFITYLERLNRSDAAMQRVIQRYAIGFIHKHCQSLSHRLLRTPKAKRLGLDVHSFVSRCKEYADRLVPGNDFEPYDHFNIKIARYIDSNPLTRSLFLGFKRLYRRPIYP